MSVALLTNNLVPYRVPLYERLADRYGVEVLCWGGGTYLPPWFDDLDTQLAAARFPARRLDGARGAFGVGAGYDVVIAPYAGGAMLPAAYLGARRHRRGFVLWASVWAQPRSLSNDLARPLTRHIYRHADAVIAYGEHARRFVAGIRGRDTDVFVAPQSVEAELFARVVGADEVAALRARLGVADRPLVLYVGRLVTEKGIEVLAEAWPQVVGDGTLVVIGDGPLVGRLRSLPGAVVVTEMAREDLPVAYAASAMLVLPSVPTPRFIEPWGLVCNEAMHQRQPVIATSAVGAVAGGLVVDGQTGLVVAPGDAEALAAAIDRLLDEPMLGERLGAAARLAVSAYTYDAMVDAFGRALEVARARR